MIELFAKSTFVLHSVYTLLHFCSCFFINMDTTVIGRVKKFPNDLYQDGGILFCKFCHHSLSTKMSTIQNHMDSSKHKRLKAQNKGCRSEKQVTLQTSYKSLENRSNFVKHFAKMCLVSNIPLEKGTHMAPFLKKYCKQYHPRT